ncbi:MAG: ATP-binding cassette domain-containing protein [Erysipelotrichaceae bacterium]|nr:ATP-binding cassette domain-containing protein [Erysipelotrichaceae bacterium]MBR3352737.1 ATP-binding cassette domain-containing protein [Erysipelotrichaceae bacterium]
MLEVRNLRKKYGDREVLSSLSFKAQKGEIVSLLGANGSGKTTTFKIMLGLLKADEGEVTYNRRKLDIRKMGYLPEERSMMYDVTVERQLMFFGKLKGMSEGNIRSEIDHWLDKTKTVRYRDMLPMQLSKGNQQKIQLIISLLHDPDVVIMDEPWTGLDQSNIALFQRVLDEQRKAGKIIVLSSHQHQQVQDICDRYLYLKDGKIRINVTRKQLENDRRRTVRFVNDRDLTITREQAITKQRSGNVTACIVQDEEKADTLLKTVRSNSNVISYSVAPMTISDLIEALR